MDSNIQSRIKALEEAISRLEFQQDTCRPLLKLARDSQSLTKMEDTMNSFNKQRLDLDHEIKSNQTAIDELSESLESSKSQSVSVITNESRRREQSMKEMNDKLNQVESGFKNLEKQNQEAIREIESKLKSEISALVENIKSRLRDERTLIRNALQESRGEVDRDLKEIRDSTAQAEVNVEKFEKKYAAIVHPVNAKDRIKGQADLRMTLVSEVTAKINEAIDDCKKQFDEKFRMLQTKYHQELQRIKFQMEEMRKWTNLQE